MRWTVHAEKPLYTDEWLDIRLADVEIPGGRRLAHRLIRTRPAAGTVVLDDRERVLLLWRHRFITDTWGYEIPMGRTEDGEEPRDAAARETEEETGWRPADLRPLLSVRPTAGISDSVHHVFASEHATYTGPPAEAYESQRIAWVPLAEIPGLAGSGEITSGSTLAALLYVRDGR